MAYSDFRNFLLGTPQQVTQAPTFSTQSQDVISQLLEQGVQQINRNPASFAPIAQRARTQFQQNTIPTLLERFNALGGGTHSSKPSGSLAGVISSAGEDLNEGLAALESQYNQRQQELGQGLIKLGLTPSFENLVTPAQPGLVHGAAAEGGKAVGELGVHAGKALIDRAFAKPEPSTKDKVAEAGMAAVGGASAAVPIATALGAASGLFWPVAAALAGGAAIGAGSYWMYNNWNKLKNWVRGGGFVEDAVQDAPPQVAQVVRQNPQQFQKLFSDPNLPNQAPEALKNLGQQQQQPQGSLDALMQNQQPVNAQVVPPAASQVATTQPTAPQPVAPQPAPQQRTQKPKVVCKNGKCKIRR